MVFLSGCVDKPKVDGSFEFVIYEKDSDNADLSDNEYLTIDSMTKTIVLTKYDGQKENCFHLRNRESYIFEPIPPGENIITWNGAFGFDVILLDERSEPKWI